MTDATKNLEERVKGLEEALENALVAKPIEPGGPATEGIDLGLQVAQLQAAVQANQYNTESAIRNATSEALEATRFELIEREMRESAEAAVITPQPAFTSERYDGPFSCYPVVGASGLRDSMRVSSGRVTAGRSVWEWDGRSSYNGDDVESWTNVAGPVFGDDHAWYVILQLELDPSATVNVDNLTYWSPVAQEMTLPSNDGLFGDDTGLPLEAYRYRPKVMIIDEPPDGIARYAEHGSALYPYGTKMNEAPPYVIQIPLAACYVNNDEIVEWKQLWQGSQIEVYAWRFYYWGPDYNSTNGGDVSVAGCIWAASLACPVCITPMCLFWTHHHFFDGTTKAGGDPRHTHDLLSAPLLPNGLPPINTPWGCATVHPQQNFERHVDYSQSGGMGYRKAVCDGGQASGKI